MCNKQNGTTFTMMVEFLKFSKLTAYLIELIKYGSKKYEYIY